MVKSQQSQNKQVKKDQTPQQSPGKSTIIKVKNNQRIQYIKAANTESLIQQHQALVDSFQLPYQIHSKSSIVINHSQNNFEEEISTDIQQDKEVNISTQILRLVQSEDSQQYQLSSPSIEKHYIQQNDQQSYKSKSSDTAYFSPYVLYTEDQDLLGTSGSVLSPQIQKYTGKKNDNKSLQYGSVSFAASALL